MIKPKSIVPTAQLEELFERINFLHDTSEKQVSAVVQLAGNAIAQRVNLGRALNEAKEKCGHGNFLRELAARCPNLSEQSARRYMRLAKRATLLDLSAAAGVCEAYTLAGIMPERAGGVDGQDGEAAGQKGQNYLVHLARFEQVITQQNPQSWPAPAKAKLRERLLPFVELYRSLV